MFQVSQSKSTTFQSCLQKYSYQYVEKLTPKRKARPLTFGDIMHKMLEAEAEEQDPYARLAEIEKKQGKMFREEIEFYGDIVADSRYIFRAYQKFWKREPLNLIPPPKSQNFAEHWLEVEIAPDILLVMRIDGFARAKKLRWLLEHKTHREFPNADHRWRNMQSAVYIRAVEMVGWFKLDGTLWNYVRSKSPTRPKLKVDGTLSEAKIDTLPEVILDAVKETKKPRDYTEFLKTSEENLSSWFERIYTPVKKSVVDMLFNDFVTTAKRMRDAESDGMLASPTRNIGKHCDWCPYEALCRAALQGLDEDFIKNREYTRTDIRDLKKVESTNASQ